MTNFFMMIYSTIFRLLYGCLFIGLLANSAWAQNPLRFQHEVAKVVANDSEVDEDSLIIFAGSSSFRLWDELTTDFKGFNVLNRGFGGSEMSDLLYYADELILAHKPQKIFIYEGDNDLGSKRPVDRIVKNADSLVNKIRAKLPNAEIYFLTPKPSPSRWHLKKNYVEFNKKLKQWVRHEDKNVKVIDVWKPLLDKNKQPRKDIFQEDMLHMNREGYALWVDILRPYLTW